MYREPFLMIFLLVPVSLFPLQILVSPAQIRLKKELLIVALFQHEFVSCRNSGFFAAIGGRGVVGI